MVDADGRPVPDSELRDFENVPLKEDVGAYFAREVLPHVPDAWMDRGKDKVGYEISFTKYFYEYTPLRPPRRSPPSCSPWTRRRRTCCGRS